MKMESVKLNNSIRVVCIVGFKRCVRIHVIGLQSL